MRSISNVFPTEKVNLVKQDGREFNEIEAKVDPKKIFIDDANIPIEKDDKIIRKLHNGITETYIVVDPGFYKGIGPIPDHYQISVESENSLREKQIKPSSIIINNNGQNSKANINSTDNSINNYNHGNKVFNELKDVAHTLPEESREMVLKSINEMENHYGKNNFKEKYNSFIEVAANHMTLFAPFIPILTNMLIK